MKNLSCIYKKYRLFKIDRNLERLCKKTARIFSVEWCGIDLLKDKNGNWYIIEINSCPSMDFVLIDINRSNKEIVKYLININNKEAKK